MQPFTTVSGKAAPLLAANIDTDVIMPKQFLKGIDRNGLDRGVFFDLRFLPSGEPSPEFILNSPRPRQSRPPGLECPAFSSGDSDMTDRKSVV